MVTFCSLFTNSAAIHVENILNDTDGFFTQFAKSGCCILPRSMIVGCKQRHFLKFVCRCSTSRVIKNINTKTKHLQGHHPHRSVCPAAGRIFWGDHGGRLPQGMMDLRHKNKKETTGRYYYSSDL